MTQPESSQPQVDGQHYSRGYDHAGRFASYWHQVDEASKLGGSMLEVGIGNGSVTSLLRLRGFDVTTVDIDPVLGPDVVADVRSLPFDDSSFDTAVVAEVLEHLPWEDVPRALGELARIVRTGAVVSVPDAQPVFALHARVPNALQTLRLVIRRRIPIRHASWALMLAPAWRRSGGDVRMLAGIDSLDQQRLPTCGQHFWELGAAGVEAPDLLALALAHGFEHTRDFRVQEHPYHHFFVFRTARPGSATG